MTGPWAGALLPLAAAVAVVLSYCCCHGASAAAAASFGDNFEITGAEDHVKTSADGQTWYLYLDNKTGVSQHEAQAGGQRLRGRRHRLLHVLRRGRGAPARRAGLRVPGQPQRGALHHPDQRVPQRRRRPGDAPLALVRPHRRLPHLRHPLEPQAHRVSCRSRSRFRFKPLIRHHHSPWLPHAHAPSLPLLLCRSERGRERERERARGGWLAGPGRIRGELNEATHLPVRPRTLDWRYASLWLAWPHGTLDWIRIRFAPARRRRCNANLVHALAWGQTMLAVSPMPTGPCLFPSRPPPTALLLRTTTPHMDPRQPPVCVTSDWRSIPCRGVQLFLLALLAAAAGHGRNFTTCHPPMSMITTHQWSMTMLPIESRSWVAQHSTSQHSL